MDEEEHASLLRTFFSKEKRFQYMKPLSGGASGYCVCFREVAPNGLSRRFVVKCPNDDEDAVLAGIRSEIQSLYVLRHAEHIVNTITINNNPLEPDHQGKGGLRIPSIILEYMENGTLEVFIQRIGGAVIPNRILWHLLLCMVRACVAIAYPPASGRKEEIVFGMQPSELVHWDMHNRNFMFGPLSNIHQEHLLVPILKLIDFDISAMKTSMDDVDADDKQNFDDELKLERYRTPGRLSAGTVANILDVGQAMTRIITRGSDDMEIDDCRERIQEEHPYLDDDLQLIIARCLAVEPLNRPKLDHLLAQTWNAVVTRDAYWYRQAPTANIETETYIRNMVRMNILNA